MLPKFLKQERKQQEKKAKQIVEKLDDVVATIGKLLDDKEVNYYEMMDIVHRLQSILNVKLTKILISNHKKIKKHEEDLIKKEQEIGELNSRINLYDNASESNKSPEEKTEQ